MKEVAIDSYGKSYIVKIRKITYGEYNKILEELSSSFKMTGSVVSGNINPASFRRMIVEKAVIMPEGVKIEDIDIISGQKIEHEALVENGIEEAGEGFFRGSE